MPSVVPPSSSPPALRLRYHFRSASPRLPARRAAAASSFVPPKTSEQILDDLSAPKLDCIVTRSNVPGPESSSICVRRYWQWPALRPSRQRYRHYAHATDSAGTQGQCDCSHPQGDGRSSPYCSQVARIANNRAPAMAIRQGTGHQKLSPCHLRQDPRLRPRPRISPSSAIHHRVLAEAVAAKAGNLIHMKSA